MITKCQLKLMWEILENSLINQLHWKDVLASCATDSQKHAKKRDTHLQRQWLIFIITKGK